MLSNGYPIAQPCVLISLAAKSKEYIAENKEWCQLVNNPADVVLGLTENTALVGKQNEVDSRMPVMYDPIRDFLNIGSGNGTARHLTIQRHRYDLYYKKPIAFYMYCHPGGGRSECYSNKKYQPAPPTPTPTHFQEYGRSMCKPAAKRRETAETTRCGRRWRCRAG
jgi:hypothetical protein